MRALQRAHEVLEYTRAHGNPAIGLLPTSAPKASAHHAAAHAAKRVRDSAKHEALKRLRASGLTKDDLTDELIDAILDEHQQGLEVLRSEGKKGGKFGQGTDRDYSYRNTRTGKQLAEMRMDTHWDKQAQAAARGQDTRRDREAQARGFVAGESALPYAASSTPARDRAQAATHARRYEAPPVAYEGPPLLLGYNPKAGTAVYRDRDVKTSVRRNLKHAKGEHIKFT